MRSIHFSVRISTNFVEGHDGDSFVQTVFLEEEIGFFREEC